MTDAALPADRYTAGEFRVGKVINRALSVLSRNIVKFSIVTGIAALPTLLIPQATAVLVTANVAAGSNPFTNLSLIGTVVVLLFVLTLLSQAIIFYGAFQDMRGRPVNLGEGLKIALGRFFPLIGLGVVLVFVVIGIIIVAALLAQVPFVRYATPLIIIPMGMLFIMWSMAAPVCVVEQAGPFRSLGRSRELTKGNRWRIFGLILLTLIVGMIIGILVGVVVGILSMLVPAGGLVVARIVSLVWNAVWTAFFVILTVVSYHDLRVARDGIDTDQIAAVFE